MADITLTDGAGCGGAGPTDRLGATSTISLWESFARRALVRPDAEAVAEDQGSIRYGELAERSEAIRDLLERTGAYQTPVCLLVRGGIAYVAAVLAATAARAIFAPLDADWPESRTLAAMQLCAPSTLVTTPDLVDQARSLIGRLEQRPRLIVLGGQGAVLAVEAGAADAGPALAPPDTDWTADSLYLVYTSGSTGAPNAVEGAHRSLAHFIAWQARAYDVGSECRVAQLAPTTFDVSLRDIFLPLYLGGCVVVPDRSTRRNPVRLRHWLADTGVNLLHAVPSVFKLLVEEFDACAGHPFAAIEKVFFSGERLYVRDAERFRDALPTNAIIANFYGPSECTLIKTHFRLPPRGALDGLEVVPIGWPIDDCTVRVSSGSGNCIAGETGEIRLRSDFLAKGYFRNPVLTAQRFRTTTDSGSATPEYRTGDLGYLDSQNCLHFVGRRDDQVKIRGNRVELGDVEHWVRGIDGVTDAAVLTIRGPGRELSLACAFTASRAIAAADLRAELAKLLPAYMVPTRYLPLAQLPLLASGKVDRKALAQKLSDGDARRSGG